MEWYCSICRSDLGGFLTETGLGTIVEEVKQKINVFYNAPTRNFNTLMDTSADIVIVGAEKIVEVGEIDPNLLMTPSIFVDYIVGGEK